jgi:hypothetical protein
MLVADAEISAYRARVRDEHGAPEAAARADVYARLRARLEAEGGVPKLAVCQKVGSAGGGYEATFSTRHGPHRVKIAPEQGRLRVIAVD